MSNTFVRIKSTNARISFDIERGSRASIDRKRARHEPVDRKRGGRVSLDRQQEHPVFIDYERECRAFIDHERHRVNREQQRCESVDCDMSIGRYGQYRSVSRMFPRPTVCAVSFKLPATSLKSRPRKSESVMVPRPPMSAVSFKPPTTRPQSRHRKSNPESVALPRPPVCAISLKPPTTSPQSRHRNSGADSLTFPRPPVCAVSFKPPTAGPQSRHFRRSYYVTGHDYPGEHQHPVYVLSPSAPAPQMHVPPRQRDRTASVEPVRRLPFLSPEVPPFDKSKPLGLTRFNPFNRLRSVTIPALQKIRRKTAGRA
ncbi:hypothetical protein BDR04DRAFT_628987 [Suillus decipiens]|nr:hypothetical protein BDR04DRAFT_628987 [Suillus decipiens]